jgi:tetratricopeptide (TPR) repeat protein
VTKQRCWLIDWLVVCCVLSVVFGSASIGCSGPATLVSLEAAEQAERGGRMPDALRLYQQAQRECVDLRPKRRRDIACSQALLGEAELQDNAGNVDAAIAVYSKIIDRQGDGEPDAGLIARAGFRMGTLLLERGDNAQAYQVWWWLVTQYANEATSGDALASLVRDARVRDPDALMAELERVLTAVADTEVADNLLWWLGDISENQKQDVAMARGYYDRLYNDRPGSGMRDDARWRAAQCSLRLQDAAGAVQRLRGLLATREVAFGTGSYFSIWLDDAQLQLGQVLRDRLKDIPGAVIAFSQLGKDYPASVLRDDALFELAATYRALESKQSTTDVCRTVAALAKQFPQSRHIATTATWGCP